MPKNRKTPDFTGMGRNQLENMARSLHQRSQANHERARQLESENLDLKREVERLQKQLGAATVSPEVKIGALSERVTKLEHSVERLRDLHPLECGPDVSEANAAAGGRYTQSFEQSSLGEATDDAAEATGTPICPRCSQYLDRVGTCRSCGYPAEPKQDSPQPFDVESFVKDEPAHDSRFDHCGFPCRDRNHPKPCFIARNVSHSNRIAIAQEDGQIATKKPCPTCKAPIGKPCIHMSRAADPSGGEEGGR